MGLFISDAMAAGETAVPDLMQFLPLVVIFVVFYFLLIPPQQKRAKDHKMMLENLSKGDEVVTAGGLLGKVKSVTDGFVEVEVAESTVVTVQKPQVLQVMPKGTIKSTK